MQSGIDSARARLDYDPITGGSSRTSPATSDGQGFFSADGPSFRDVLDAINPLNHIPIVSSLFAAATGHQPSTASQLVGGALLGGPIGFVASLANAIFKDATGSSPTEAVYAALTSDPAAATATQIASSESEHTTELAALAPAMPAAATQIDPAFALAQPEARARHVASSVSARPNEGPLLETVSQSQAVLALYGNSPASAHDSYKKAQLRPYLTDVTLSRVL